MSWRGVFEATLQSGTRRRGGLNFRRSSGRAAPIPRQQAGTSRQPQDQARDRRASSTYYQSHLSADVQRSWVHPLSRTAAHLGSYPHQP